MGHRGHRGSTEEHRGKPVGAAGFVQRRHEMHMWLSSVLLCAAFVSSVSHAAPAHSNSFPPAPAQQTVVQAEAKSAGCMSCHTTTDRHTMHQNPGVVLGCTDCHGGDPKTTKPEGAQRKDAAYLASLRRAHVLP